jgi:hypothetical protein
LERVGVSAVSTVGCVEEEAVQDAASCWGVLGAASHTELCAKQFRGGVFPREVRRERAIGCGERGEVGP